MSTAIAVVSKLILSGLPIAQIVVGALYHNECPMQHFIPIYLEVMGAYGLLALALSFLPFVNDLTPYSIAFGSVNLLFFLCWFTTGNYWIYSIYEPNYNKTVSIDTYCDKTLYLFAFWTTNVTYVQLVLFVCCCCFCARHLPSVMTSPS
ncbi:transmembrane protein 272-like [Pempheris klunzingeri]|uniref:transmembrane protein 272-like n=1 Tax=Pempheris klunzingeri TaxID=3127111 RepID=UPI00397F6DD1